MSAMLESVIGAGYAAPLSRSLHLLLTSYTVRMADGVGPRTVADGALRMGSGRANRLTLRKNRYKNKPNLALGDQFWYQNPPFKEITIKWHEQKVTIFRDTSGT